MQGPCARCGLDCLPRRRALATGVQANEVREMNERVIEGRERVEVWEDGAWRVGNEAALLEGAQGSGKISECSRSQEAA